MLYQLEQTVAKLKSDYEKKKAVSGERPSRVRNERPHVALEAPSALAAPLMSDADADAPAVSAPSTAAQEFAVVQMEAQRINPQEVRHAALARACRARGRVSPRARLSASPPAPAPYCRRRPRCSA